MINVPLFLFTYIYMFYWEEGKRGCDDHSFIVKTGFPLTIIMCERHTLYFDIIRTLDPSVILYSIGINALHDSESFISNWKWIWVVDFVVLSLSFYCLIWTIQSTVILKAKFLIILILNKIYSGHISEIYI